MRKVYVTNKGAHDFSAAKRWGELVFLTEGEIPRYNTSQMFRAVEDVLRDSSPGDYLLLTSLTTLNCVACSYFANKHGRLNLLLFQPHSGKGREPQYLERVVVFNHEIQAK